ncbi:DUF3426 domain-containing protein [Herbaspirillum sp. GCM10030257]|uniref:DUF3426 domain-containing protein n=1 Tax=Herbaspirillum sp. GCM10030257 TaxID=3273393 RepID=UPI00361CECB5
MALATQCPHCHTTFRVAHDQLKLRAGLVRCGSCKQIFNGIENLLRPEELAAGGTDGATTPASTQAPAGTPATLSGTPSGTTAPVCPASTDSEGPPASVPSVASVPSSDAGKQIMPDHSPTGSGTGEHTEAEAPPSATIDTAGIQNPITTTGAARQKDDPLLRMTLMDIAHVPRKPSADEPADSNRKNDTGDDFVEQAIDDLQTRPWRRKPDASLEKDGDALDQADAADYEEPGFVRQARRRETIGRALTIFMGTASALLLGVLIAQAAYIFRNQIAARLPQAQPVLAAACERSGCQVGLPAQIDSVSIDSSELQTLAPDSNTFSLTVLLRNHSMVAQAWPSIELTLNDTSEKPLARRVFMPREYLASSKELERGFAANSEQPLKLYFELSQLKAAGYRVYLFYP